MGKTIFIGPDIMPCAPIHEIRSGASTGSHQVGVLATATSAAEHSSTSEMQSEFMTEAERTVSDIRDLITELAACPPEQLTRSLEMMRRNSPLI